MDCTSMTCPRSMQALISWLARLVKIRSRELSSSASERLMMVPEISSFFFAEMPVLM